MTREELLLHIQRLSFVIDEATLFLDTHPDNPAATSYFLDAKEKLRNAVDAYEGQYGALTHGGVITDYRSYVGGIWPWQKNENEETMGGKR